MNKRWIGGVVAGLLAISLALPGMAEETAKPAAKPAAAGAKPGAKRGRGGGARRYKQILEKLNLTPEQKPKVDKLVKDLQADLKKLREAPGTPQEKRPQIQARQKEFRAALDKILTPEQQATLKEELAKARKANGAGKKPGAKAAAKPAKQ